MEKELKKVSAAVLATLLFCGTTAFASSDSGMPGRDIHDSASAVQTSKPAAQAGTLDIDTSRYDKQTMHVDGHAVVFRAYTDRVYVAKPVNKDCQSMNIYVPEEYYEGQTINGYTAWTAPIFMPNTVGGYMPAQAGTPSEQDRMMGDPNAILIALARGHVVAAPGARGRTTADAKGNYIGKAPACIVDMKAAVRYIRHNKGSIPGDTEKIISDGTSAGGALSALMGATGDSMDYEPYLQALGAADERDDIFASSVYCPITDLDHADMAYEWVFNGVHEYHQSSRGGALMPAFIRGGHGKIIPLGPGPVIIQQPGRPDNAPGESAQAQSLTAAQITASQTLKSSYAAYINSLDLKDAKGVLLTLDKEGNGTFKDYIQSIYIASAQKALDDGMDLSAMDWLTIRDGTVTAMDMEKYASYVTRLKAVPAFDAFDLSGAENQEFGTAAMDKQHFTKYSQKYSTVKKSRIADKNIVREMNPLNYIGNGRATVAKHWRIRHGAKDRDTVISVPAVLALKLQNAGYDVDFSSPWGQGHGGDYDLDELFAWADRICK
ncbi:MAG: alpha/beta hydrolase [Megasphaera sp.]|jgi:hypothetical protein|nr:alpha/beta hydrolase [Megasphaera sp.]